MTVKLPLYAQLKEIIIAAIVRGDLAPGDQIPSQRILCERYSMSHMTVRRAISELINEGVIYAIPGKGLYVTERKQPVESGPLIGFAEEMARRGMLASSRILTAEIVGASTVLSSALGVALGMPLVHLRRLRLVDGEPMALQSNYLPYALCPGLLDHDLERGSLFSVLRDDYGLRLADGTRMVEAALADLDQARLLGLALPAPLLVVEQLTYLDSGQAIEFVRTAYRGDRYRLGPRF
ncbi:MAG: GntR family transcriptional regulator [Roseiflexaceae bacterium]